MKKILVFITILSFLISNNLIAQKNTERLPLQKVLTAYLNLKNALVLDDSTKATAVSASLCTAIDTVNIDKLTLEHKKAWTKLSSRLYNDAVKIKEATTIDEQRRHFKSLSLIMHKLTGRLNINKVKLYYQYCETENAYWISTEAAIKNPYTGRKATDCGYIKAELKAHK